MEKLLELAKEFLEKNQSFNEVELTDGMGNKVKLLRYSPVIYQYPYYPNYQYMGIRNP